MCMCILYQSTGNSLNNSNSIPCGVLEASTELVVWCCGYWARSVDGCTYTASSLGSVDIPETPTMCALAE